MLIPFDSLDSTAWAVWADFCRENNRTKAAAFGDKVARSLERFAVARVNPKAYLQGRYWYFSEDLGPAGNTTRHPNGAVRPRPNPPRYPQRWGRKQRKMAWCVSQQFVNAHRPYFNYGRVHWTRTQPPGGDPGERWCPADFGNPWQLEKLSFKFFKLLNRTARGLHAGKVLN